METKDIQLAVTHILASRLTLESLSACFILHGPDKNKLASEFRRQITEAGGAPYVLTLPDDAYNERPWLQRMLQTVIESDVARILLLNPPFVHSNLMQLVGRPDQGVSLSGDFYCDWALPEDSFVRIYSVDQDEIRQYRKALMSQLHAQSQISITTDAGTNLHLKSQTWNDQETEVNTSPQSGSANGKIVYDGSLFWGKPKLLVEIAVEDGRISSVKCEDDSDPQYETFLALSRKDNGASVLAELGVGLNPKAIPTGHAMEAEMSRLTCHLDFGNSIPYGGQNRSSVHYGGIILYPTIEINGRIVLDHGYLRGSESR